VRSPLPQLYGQKLFLFMRGSIEAGPLAETIFVIGTSHDRQMHGINDTGKIT
jgi:hypothetical protein